MPRWVRNQYPFYRLMCLSTGGTVYEKCTGSLTYLHRIAAHGRVQTHCRQWIELSTEPAHLHAHDVYRSETP